MDSDALRRKLLSGELVDLRTGDAAVDDPARADQWPTEREVSAELLAEVLTTTVDADAPGRRVRLAGARIAGSLDLHLTTLTRGLRLFCCFVAQPIVLEDADAREIDLRGSQVYGINGSGLHCRGPIYLSDGFRCEGEVCLSGARIGGVLDCDGGTFRNQRGDALRADTCDIAGDMYCRQEFRAEGTVSLVQAQIGGQFSADGGTFHNPGGRALSAERLTVKNHMFFRRPFMADGAVRLPGAQIGGSLICDGGIFRAPDRTALDIDSCAIKGGLFCEEGFHAEGQVSLMDAGVEGKFSADDGIFHRPGGCALNASRLTVGNDVLFRGTFAAEGEVHLGGAQIGGMLNANGGTFRNPGGYALNGNACVVGENLLCGEDFLAEGEVSLMMARIGGFHASGGTFCNPNGRALTADRLSIRGNMSCGEGFTADGEVSLRGAQIGGQLQCRGGTFRNEGACALDAGGLVVQDMFCDEKFVAEGQVRLAGARIGGRFECTGGTFSNPGDVAIDFEHVEIRTRCLFQLEALDGKLNLAYAKVGRWCDDIDTWPKKLSLQGFSYEAIESKQPVGPRKRVGWLRRNTEQYQPQPYEQLAAAYRREGDVEAARKVLIAKQWSRRARPRSQWRRWPAIAWSLLLRGTIGYGYRPWQIMWPITVLFFAGWFLFRWDRQHGLIVAAGSGKPQFSAARYTLDLLLPVANLGERAKFTALGDAAWHSFAFTLSGWLLALILVAGLAGVFKRD